jgi:hypothetical protein
MEIEIGNSGNPVVFTGVIAGQEFQHPNNPFYLWNDKGGLSGSMDAKDITLSVLGMSLIGELAGYSDGSPSQLYTVAYAPIISGDALNPVVVKVNGVIWSAVFSFDSSTSSDEVYIVDYNAGTILFGDGLNGKIPMISSTIEISYTPDRTDFGAEIQEFAWLGIRSAGVVSNPVTVSLERQTSTDELHLTAAHKHLLTVTGVYLNTDSHRLGTNYYTGGTFNSVSGYITLGTTLPNYSTEVLVDYTYTIVDDAEAAFTQIGGNISHTFLNPLPSNCAKQISFRIVAPATTSPSGLINLRFRIRLDFNS